MSERTIVLVHGAFADASGFAGVIRALKSAGHLVIAHPNPLRSLALDVAAVSAVVKATAPTYGFRFLRMPARWTASSSSPRYGSSRI